MELKKQSADEQCDAFFSDTFLPTTHRKKVLTFKEINEYYQQWCEAMNQPPLAGHYILGRRLASRYHRVIARGVKYWFLEVRPTLLEG